MKYCKACLTTDLRPNALFSNDDICIACQYNSEEKTGNSSLKLAQLMKKIIDTKKSIRRKSPYDCIVGVSGGKDSTRQAHWVRDRLGMRPLLVCCGYPPLQMTDIGAKNLSNIISMGFDLIVATPAPQTSANLSLVSFKKFGNVCKSTEMALFSTVPRIAIDIGVNMIFWGENAALQVGDSKTRGVDEFDANNLRKLNTLTAGGTDWIKKSITQYYHMDHYLYPEEMEFNDKKVSIFYLGPAWDDWYEEENATYAALQGLTLRDNEEHITGDILNANMLDEEFTNINMMIRYYKFGFGRTTDTINEMIRSGSITREDAIEVVDKYDGMCDDSIIEKYCIYVGIKVDEFWETVNQWVNEDLFIIHNTKRPKRKFQVGVNYEC